MFSQIKRSPETFVPRIPPDSEAYKWFEPFENEFIVVTGRVKGIAHDQYNERNVSYLKVKDLTVVESFTDNSPFKHSVNPEYPMLEGKYKFRASGHIRNQTVRPDFRLQLLIHRNKAGDLTVRHDTATFNAENIRALCLKRFLIALDAVNWNEDEMYKQLKSLHMYMTYCMLFPFEYRSRLKMARVWSMNMRQYNLNAVDAIIGKFVNAFTKGNPFREWSPENTSLPHFIKAVLDESELMHYNDFYNNLRSGNLDRDKVWASCPEILKTPSQDEVDIWKSLKTSQTDDEQLIEF